MALDKLFKRMETDFNSLIQEKSLSIVTKVSGTNWLCVKMPDGAWLPVFKLTDEQVRDYTECTEVFRHTTRISNVESDNETPPGRSRTHRPGHLHRS